MSDEQSINEKMKQDWNRRAKVDAKYWVAATQEADDASYDASAVKDVNAFLEGLNGRVPATGRVLDLGCGIGRMTAPLAAHFAEVVGVDVAEVMIEDARKRHTDITNLSFEVNDGSSLSAFEDNSFDLILSYSVLPHLPFGVCEKYFKEVNRILKPGGWFRYQFWVGPSRPMADNDTLNIRVYSETQFNALHEVSGLSVVEQTQIEYFDPVLKLNPVWVNAQNTGHASNNAIFEDSHGSDEEGAELELEYGLLLYLGFKHQERGENEKAESVFEQAVHLAPDRPDAYVQWATLRVERDDLKGALIVFETLNEKNTAFAPGWLFRAQILEADDQLDEARSCLTKYESAGPEIELDEVYQELKTRLN